MSINVERINQTEVCFGTFFCRYLMRNVPCIINSKSTNSWYSIQNWVLPNGQPNLHFLQKTFGDAIAPVTSFSSNQLAEYGSNNSGKMRFSDFLEYVKNRDTKYSEKDWLYLKDWHFTKNFPEYSAYVTPKLFSSDWMNEYWDIKNDPEQSDYRFSYFGVKGSWTPFHADVMRSYSWSANICGKKLWYVVPPGNEAHFQEGNRLISDIRKKQDKFQAAQVVEIVQEPGEIIFVPSNWHHQVHNLEDTISVNHNWFNATNIDKVWMYIKNRLADVKKELEDCRESLENWNQQCQLVLKADIGIDFQEFTTLIDTIESRRKNHLVHSSHPDFDTTTIFCHEHEFTSIIDRKNCPNCLDSLEKSVVNKCQCSKHSENLCKNCQHFLAVYDMETCCEMKRRLATYNFELQ